ncbi:hypothetical protein CBOM_07930 [Ceraceosorus bombacis]|uniref:Uncharacterized protein n=1 Tax=Ceraceosorus bombacis TaxID=401625 RepID=A0A0P1BPL8_9BASI|nr:hypothetical protein CBOM_07930 [Ceraceosorus bombacis]
MALHKLHLASMAVRDGCSHEWDSSSLATSSASLSQHERNRERPALKSCSAVQPEATTYLCPRVIPTDESG